MIHLLDLPQSGAGLALVRALGWTLLHFCWQGIVIAATLWCVLGMIGARFSQARYAAACVALALMVALPAATLLRLAKTELAASRAKATLPALVFDVTAIDAGNASPVPLKERAKEALERAVPWVPAVWMAGVVLFLGRLSLGMAAVRRMRSVAAEPMPETYEELFREMARRLGVARAVELMHSAVVEVPTVIGWLRPMVLVPVGCFTGLSPVQIEALLAHELAHIRRHDYLVSVCQSVVEALLFYHPAVWWVSRQVRRERECCCDELAIAASGDVLAYARALSWLEQQRSAMPEIALGANGGVLTMRIRRMLGYPEGPVVSLPVVATVTLVMLAAVGAYFGEVAHAQRKAAMTTAQVSLVDPATSVIANLQAAKGEGLVQTGASAAEAPDWRSLALQISIAQSNLDHLERLLQPASPNDAWPPPRVDSPDKVRAKIVQAKQELQTLESRRAQLHSVYLNWLDQDVAWLITMPERATFLNLTNDEERNRFIESFWARRDPPEVPAGAFRQETYRRIAYSNANFTADKPGWATDRGHVYIVYGKPDEITVRSNGRGGYPFQIWHYNSLPGLGENVNLSFVDTTGRSDYHYTIDGPDGAVLNGAPNAGFGPAASAATVFGVPQMQPAGQTPGTLEGTVIDPTGAVVPRATVTATNTATGAPVSFTTDNTGKFSFTALPPAAYTIDVAARGFQKLHQENVRVGGGVVTLGLKLSVGAATESLTVHPQNAGGPSAATGRSTGPMLVSGGVMAQQATFQPAPVYPPIAKAAHVQGAVVLRAIVSPEGVVQNLQVISGAPMLTSSAMDAVKTWTYKPYLLNGRPVAVDTIITVHYTLPPESAATAGEPGAAATARPHGPIRVSSGTAAGMAISQPTPVYPEEAKAARVQGVVVLHAVISKGGEVENLQVVSGPKELVASAIDAVSQWRYSPYLLNGEPTEVETTINVNYTLGDDSQPQAGGPSVQAPNPAARVPVRGVFAPKRAAPVLASFVPPAPVTGAAEETPTDAAGNPLRKIGGNVIAPVPIYEVEPEFTPEARAAKVGAVVVVGFVVNQDGRAENVHVVRGDLDDKRIDAAILAGLEGKALDAVQQYRFRPAMEKGHPVPVSLNIEVNLKMF